MSQQHTLGKVHTTVKGNMNEGKLRVTYHSTDVVVVEGENITLNTGGWFTATTKTRMNQASSQFGLNYRVSQEKGEWWVDTPSEGKVKMNSNSITFKR